MCRPGEPGEFVGKIVMGKNICLFNSVPVINCVIIGHPARDFQGYVDKVATNKKIICDVFRKGDMYFR